MKVTKQMWTETAHRLPRHPGRCRFLHGHSYLWEVTLEGDELGPNGMLLDFSELKAAMTAVIDPFDHALILQTGEKEGMIVLSALSAFGLAERVVFVNYPPTAENMAAAVANTLKEQFFPGFTVTVKLWETRTSYAEVSA